MHPDATDWHGSPIRLTSGGAHAAPQGRHTPRHRHETWELVYYRQGQIRYQIDEGRPCPASPGIIWLTPPGHTHIEEALTAFANYFIHFTAPAGAVWPERLHDDADGSIGRLCAAIVRELSRREIDRAAMLDCLGHELALRLRRAAQAPRPDPAVSLVMAAEMFLTESLGQGISLAGLAGRLDISVSTLRAAFHRVRGHSPRAAVQRLRAERALLLLSTSDLPLESVAEQCGYDSASHLGRWMRRLHGVSAGALRRAAQDLVDRP